MKSKSIEDKAKEYAEGVTNNSILQTMAQQAYLAGASDNKAEPTPDNGMRWVKASERLPIEGSFFCRTSYNKMFIGDISPRHLAYGNMRNRGEDYEWLDESSSPNQLEEEYCKGFETATLKWKKELEELRNRVKQLEQTLNAIVNLSDESWTWLDQKVRVKHMAQQALTK